MRVSTILAASAAALLAGSAGAGVTLNSARLGAVDVVALGKFYEAAFGLKEVNRLSFGGGQVEIFLNFGDTVDAAKANTQAQVVLMHRDSNDLKDPVPHIIFNVTDMAATVAAVKAAGGGVDGEPRPFGNSGLVIGFATDPAGNRIELIQPAKR
jgi:predicted enzyme related to lactoylglutathione lyase